MSGFFWHYLGREKWGDSFITTSWGWSSGFPLGLCWCWSWWWVGVWVPARPPLLSPQQGRIVVPHFCSSHGLHWQHGGDARRASLPLGSAENPDSALGLLRHHPNSDGEGCLSTSGWRGSPRCPTDLHWHDYTEGSSLSLGGWKSWQRGLGSLLKSQKGRSPGSPARPHWHGWEPAPRFLCRVWLEERSYWLSIKVSVLLGCSFGSQEQASIGAFWGLHSLAFPGCQLLQSQLWDRWGKTENICSSDSKVPGGSAFSPPPFRVFLCLFYIHCTGFQLYSVGRIRKGPSIPPSYMWKFLQIIFQRLITAPTSQIPQMGIVRIKWINGAFGTVSGTYWALHKCSLLLLLDKWYNVLVKGIDFGTRLPRFNSQLLHWMIAIIFGKLLNLSVPKLPHYTCNHNSFFFTRLLWELKYFVYLKPLEDCLAQCKLYLSIRNSSLKLQNFICSSQHPLK